MSAVPKSDLSVGQVAARSGVAVSTIHFYEAEGLIGGWRTRANHRRYRRSVLRRIAIIRIGLEAGIPLREIKTTLATLPNNRTPKAADWNGLAAQWRDRLQARIERLTQLRDRLGGCIGCGCLSVETCPLRNADDELAAHGAGAVLLDRERGNAAK
ncbi:redox-sensitive transcriptional activator SoxR [Pelagibacterium sp.]|uniref:redox-sensitive transcriptional activator SoxR n=1 Tax=Pelagibacterium sp. TaxID=1967288 RepID=UPI003A91AE7A